MKQIILSLTLIVFIQLFFGIAHGDIIESWESQKSGTIEAGEPKAIERIEKAIGFHGIPEPPRKVIFKESKFVNYVTLNLPREDSPASVKRIKSYRRGAFNLPPVYRCHAYEMNSDVLSLLMKHGFVNLEEFSLPRQGRDAKYTFLSYTAKIIPYIVEGYKRSSINFGIDGFKIKLASRLLKSIDSKNENKALGTYVVTFSYTFQKEFPYYEELQRIHPKKFPLIKKIYKGEAKAYLDPKTNLWILEKLILPK